MKAIPKTVKIIVSFLLIALILWKFPVANIFETIKHANFVWVLLAFFIGELVIINQAFRWNYLLISLIINTEQKIKFNVLLKYTVIGYLFNLFTPGGIGGDIYRSLVLGRVHNIIKSSVASVFIAKIFGLFALCLLFWFAFPYFELIPKQAIYFMLLSTVALIALFLFIIFNPLKKGKIGVFAKQLREYKKYPLRLFFALLGSILMQVLIILMHFALFKAVGVSVPLSVIFLTVSITILLTSIPISFNGIGVREWSMLSLTAAYINSEQLLASLLLSYAIIILQALQGYIFFIFNKKSIK